MDFFSAGGVLSGGVSVRSLLCSVAVHAQLCSCAHGSDASSSISTAKALSAVVLLYRDIGGGSGLDWSALAVSSLGTRKSTESLLPCRRHNIFLPSGSSIYARAGRKTTAHFCLSSACTDRSEVSLGA